MGLGSSAPQTHRSPDLAHSDLHLLKHMKCHLQGQHLASGEDFKVDVRTSLSLQQPSFYCCGFSDLMYWYKVLTWTVNMLKN